MRCVKEELFKKNVPGGMTDAEGTIMKVEKMVALSDRLKMMMRNISPVTEISHPDSFNITKVMNQAGFFSYFKTGAISFVESLEHATAYLSNAPGPGKVGNGGYIFVKVEQQRKRLGEVFRVTIWYIIAPLSFETVKMACKGAECTEVNL